MHFDDLHADDDAVAPVIAVVLMVSVAVVIAGIAGIFVSGQNDVNVSPAPQVQSTFQYTETVTGATFNANGCDGGGFDASNGELEIQHNSGASIRAGNLTIIGGDHPDRKFHECSAVGAESDVTTNDAAYVETSLETPSGSSGGVAARTQATCCASGTGRPRPRTSRVRRR